MVLDDAVQTLARGDGFAEIGGLATEPDLRAGIEILVAVGDAALVVPDALAQGQPFELWFRGHVCANVSRFVPRKARDNGTGLARMSIFWGSACHTVGWE
ncbi:hypothetical protein M673_03815 [Aureimonas sp. AU20]|nr:hypothetical protein M673_03815 [Aureimonas sp. AU20]